MSEPKPDPAATSSAPVPGDQESAIGSTKRSSRKKVLKVVGLLVALGLVSAALNTWRVKSRLEARLSLLRDQGVALTLDELYSTAVAPDENALTWLRQAQPHTDQLSVLLNDYYLSKEFGELRPSLEQMAVLQVAFEKHAVAFSKYASAAKCLRFQTDWRIGPVPSASLNGLMADCQEARSIMRHCSALVGLLMAEGRLDEALETSLQMMALSTLIENEPFVTGFLVGTACRLMSLQAIVAVLERSSLTAEQRDQLDAALAESESADGFIQALVSERIFGLAWFRADVFGGPLLSILARQAKLDACDYLDLIDEMSRLSTIPRHAANDKLDLLTKRKIGPIASMTVQALMSARNAYDRAIAKTRCVRLLNALQRAFPNGIPANPPLSELPGDADSRHDPFTGKPLLIIATNKAVVVYSVGENGKDDSGSIDNSKDVGVRIEPKAMPVLD